MCYCFSVSSLQNLNDAVMPSLSEQEPNNETREALSFLRVKKAELEATPEEPALSFFGYKQHLKCVALVGSILEAVIVDPIYGREEECSQACLDYGAECVGFEFLYN